MLGLFHFQGPPLWGQFYFFGSPSLISGSEVGVGEPPTFPLWGQAGALPSFEESRACSEPQRSIPVVAWHLCSLFMHL